MTRNRKALGFALFVVMALGAAFAGNASAAFTAESVPVKRTLRAEGTQKFIYEEGGLTIECSTVGGEGTQSVLTTTSSSSTVSYSNCNAGSLVAHVSTTQCSFNFSSATGSSSITVGIACGASGHILITITSLIPGSSLCTLELGTQTPGGTATGTSIGTGTTREVTVHNTLASIGGHRSGSLMCGAESSSSGTYEGNTITTGESTGSTPTHVGIEMS